MERETRRVLVARVQRLCDLRDENDVEYAEILAECGGRIRPRQVGALLHYALLEELGK